MWLMVYKSGQCSVFSYYGSIGGRESKISANMSGSSGDVGGALDVLFEEKLKGFVTSVALVKKLQGGGRGGGGGGEGDEKRFGEEEEEGRNNNKRVIMSWPGEEAQILAEALASSVASLDGKELLDGLDVNGIHYVVHQSRCLQKRDVRACVRLCVCVGKGGG